tara:strand:- start:1048 stop:3195 length:2148 start_codon:yes stop_codon:yes gene_type:complete
MAILNQIRQRSFFLIVVIAMALFSFVLADVFRNSGSTDLNASIVGSVNGIDIERDDFMSKVDNVEKQNRGSRSAIQSMSNIWNQEIKKLVLKTEFDEIGLRVEKNMMRSLLKNNLSAFNEFNDSDGNFDESKLNQFILNLKEISPETTELQNSLVNYESWNIFESNIAAFGLEQTYNKLVESGINTTIFEGLTEHQFNNDLVDFEYVKVPFSKISDSLIQVKKSDVNQYIKKNQNKYKTTKSRAISFVKFEENASSSDKLSTEITLQNLIEDGEEYDFENKKSINIPGFRTTKNNEEFVNVNSAIKYFDSYVFKKMGSNEIPDEIFNLSINELYGPYSEDNYMKVTKLIDTKRLPDSVKVRHILIPYFGSLRSDSEVSMTRDQAKAKSDSILRILKKNRNKFNSLLKFSSDKVSNQNGGEIEFAYFDSFAEEFRNFSFENNIGSIDVVETEFGFHIIEILSQNNKQRAIKVANLALKIEPSEITRDSIYNIASRFEIDANEDNFDDLANQSEFDIKKANNIKEFDENIPVLGKQRSIVKWAYNETTNIGDVKRFNLQEGGYAIAILKSINDKELMDYDKAKITAIPELKKQKKAEQIIKMVNVFNLNDISKIFNLSIETSLAVSLSSPVISGVGNEPSVIGFAMGLEKNVISKPIIGKSGVFYIKLTDKRVASEIDNFQVQINKINSSSRNASRANAYDALKEKAEIEDFRSIFY